MPTIAAMAELISTAEAAALYGVTDETVRRWAKTGRIRHVKLPSGRIKLFRSDVTDDLAPVEPTEPAA